MFGQLKGGEFVFRCGYLVFQFLEMKDLANKSADQQEGYLNLLFSVRK